MSGRGYRGGRGGGVGPPRGRGSRKRPLTNSYDDSGPPALKTNRGPGAPRQTERSGNWPRGSGSQYGHSSAPGPPSSSSSFEAPEYRQSYSGSFSQQQQRPRDTFPQQRSGGNNYDSGYQSNVRVSSQSSSLYGPPGSSSSSRGGALPKPIPAARRDHSPSHHYQQQYQDYEPRERQRSPHVRMRPLSRSPPPQPYYPESSSQQQPSYRNSYQSPPPPSPPRDYPQQSSRGRISSSRGPAGRGRGRVARGDRGVGRGGAPYSVRGSSTSRGGHEKGASRKASALQRLGPKLRVTERLGGRAPRGGGRGRGRGGATPAAAYAEGTSGNTNESSNIEDEESTLEAEDPSNNERSGDLDSKGNLSCCQCGFRCGGHQIYEDHLLAERHTMAMKALRTKLQNRLSILRNLQRKIQREITNKMDKEGSNLDDDGRKKPALFCKVCKLIFNEGRAEHNISEKHQEISGFLSPKCSICNGLQFFSPMAYHKHIASLEHIKVANAPTLPNTDDKSAEEAKDQKDDDEENIMEFNPDDFVTLDEVGGDDDDDVGSGNEDTNEEKEESSDVKEETVEGEDDVKDVVELEIKDEPPSSPSPIIVNPDHPVGVDYVRQVIMFYCDLCHKYLPKITRGDPEELVDSHCSSPGHQTAFVKKEDEFRREEQEALRALVKEEQPNNSPKSIKKETTNKETFNDEDQLDYEAESVNGDVKSEPDGPEPDGPEAK